MSTAKKGVRVRATCPAGHLTEATSDPGKVTWRGQCAHDGCTAAVVAKRVPRDLAPVPTADAPAETPNPPDPNSLKRVSYDVPSPRKAKPKPDPVTEPGAGEPQPVSVLPAPGGQPGGQPGGGSELVQQPPADEPKQRGRFAFRHPVYGAR